jgi:Na+/phosphate symporter
MILIVLCNKGILFGQNMAEKHEEVRQRKRTLDISTAFITNYQNGVGKERLTTKEHRT